MEAPFRRALMLALVVLVAFGAYRVFLVDVEGQSRELLGQRFERWIELRRADDFGAIYADLVDVSQKTALSQDDFVRFSLVGSQSVMAIEPVRVEVHDAHAETTLTQTIQPKQRGAFFKMLGGNEPVQEALTLDWVRREDNWYWLVPLERLRHEGIPRARSLQELLGG